MAGRESLEGRAVEKDLNETSADERFLELTSEIEKECDLSKIDELVKLESGDPARIPQFLDTLIKTLRKSNRLDEAMYVSIVLYRQYLNEAGVESLNSLLSDSLQRQEWSDNAILILCYVVCELEKRSEPILAGDSMREKVHAIVRSNYDVVSRAFASLGKTVPPILVPKDASGRPPPPRPVADKRKPTDNVFAHQDRGMKRALPGYTTGALAAEYAKRKNLV